MTVNWERYDAALKRNVAEASNAILKRRALIAWHSADTRDLGPLGFFDIAAHALYNDLIAHAARLFDHHPDAASFWYVVRCDESNARAQAASLGVNLDALRALAEKLKTIRDKTLFHIDKKAVEDPSVVWATADVKGNELGSGLEDAFNLLAALDFKRRGVRPDVPNYDGSDVVALLRSYRPTDAGANSVA